MFYSNLILIILCLQLNVILTDSSQPYSSKHSKMIRQAGLAHSMGKELSEIFCFIEVINNQYFICGLFYELYKNFLYSMKFNRNKY
jgi:hypothetical protein